MYKMGEDGDKKMGKIFLKGWEDSMKMTLKKDFLWCQKVWKMKDDRISHFQKLHLYSKWIDFSIE